MPLGHGLGQSIEPGISGGVWAPNGYCLELNEYSNYYGAELEAGGFETAADPKDYVNCGDVSPIDDADYLTFSCFVKVKNLTDTHYIISKRLNATNKIEVDIGVPDSTPKLTVNLSKAEAVSASADFTADDTWTHIAFVFESLDHSRGLYV